MLPRGARLFLLHDAPSVGIHAAIHPIPWERFEAADEAFVTNAFGGAVALRGRGGPIFERVAELFEHLWHSAG